MLLQYSIIKNINFHLFSNLNLVCYKIKCISIENKKEFECLGDTCYKDKWTKGRWTYTSTKSRLYCAANPLSQYMVMWAADRFKR